MLTRLSKLQFVILNEEVILNVFVKDLGVDSSLEPIVRHPERGSHPETFL